MDGPRRRSPLRSFALGSLVGAAGAIAAVRRVRRTQGRATSSPAGLAAFEEAPCFLEQDGGVSEAANEPAERRVD
jgi:hypothetical protein